MENHCAPLGHLHLQTPSLKACCLTPRHLRPVRSARCDTRLLRIKDQARKQTITPRPTPQGTDGEGVPRLASDLRRSAYPRRAVARQGIRVPPERVARHVRPGACQCVASQGQGRSKKTSPEVPAAPDLVKRGTPAAPRMVKIAHTTSGEPISCRAHDSTQFISDYDCAYRPERARNQS